MKIKVELETLKTLFDVAANSMDFGSGFLDTEEVQALRSLAETLGIDPILATPENQVRYFYPDAPEEWTKRWDWFLERQREARSRSED